MLTTSCINNKKEEQTTPSPVNQITELEYYSEMLGKYSLDKFPSENCVAKRIAITPDLSEIKDLPEDIKERIKKDYQMDGQNFNCHYKIVSWGCGTSCQIIIVIDVLNGNLVKKFTCSLGSHFDLMSRLLILNPPNESEIDTNYRETIGLPEFWELKNGVFSKLN